MFVLNKHKFKLIHSIFKVICEKFTGNNKNNHDLLLHALPLDFVCIGEKTPTN